MSINSQGIFFFNFLLVVLCIFVKFSISLINLKKFNSNYFLFFVLISGTKFIIETLTKAQIKYKINCEFVIDQ